MSSPVERKVSWCWLNDFKAVHQVIRPLVDSGLESPRGIAYASQGSFLYVADYSGKRILRYTIGIRSIEYVPGMYNYLPYELYVEGTATIILEGVTVQWVAVCAGGNLFYTVDSDQTVNFMSRETIMRVAAGELKPNQLKSVTQRESEALSAAQTSATSGNTTKRNGAAAVQAADAAGSVRILYQASATAFVHSPNGVATDGSYVYWGNSASSTSATSSASSGNVSGQQTAAVARGSVMPQAPLTREPGSQPATFGALGLASNTAMAFGIACTRTGVVFTDRRQFIYGVPKTGGVVTTLTDVFDTPRGVVWDGDSTVYIADYQGNTIQAMPVGQMEHGQSPSLTVNFNGPWGLTLITQWDPAFQSVLRSSSRNPKTHSQVLLLIGTILVTLAFAQM